MPGNQLVIRDMALNDIGMVLARSGFFADSRDANKAIVKVLAGQELGVGPITAMTGIHIIQGKPQLSANLMAATIKRSGRYNYRVRELTDTICKLEFLELNGESWESVGVSEFSIQDAKRAKTKNLDQFPRNMLFARAMSNGAKWFCPDVFGGTPVYTPGELGEAEESDSDPPIDITAEVAAELEQPVIDISNDPASQQQCERIKDLAKQLGMPPAALKAVLQKRGVQRTSELTVGQAVDLVVAMSRKLSARDQATREAANATADPPRDEIPY